VKDLCILFISSVRCFCHLLSFRPVISASSTVCEIIILHPDKYRNTVISLYTLSFYLLHVSGYSFRAAIVPQFLL
jgi:hypothetical protein